ncbi:MAG: DUF4416 family protein [Chitinispirillales bacterium]|jgi:hypothetical protein|nr:DUF4416 family protein [Chitinispirillales bacterium]
MAEIKSVAPVKYFAAILYKEKTYLEQGLASLEKRWGSIDIYGADHLFDVTDYYEAEMGTPLFRRLVSFEKLLCPSLVADMKLGCNEVETLLSVDGKRTINIDAGYLDHNKVLLASAKEAGQKIYLGKGIYADLAGRYKAGSYRPFEWSFPDFRDGRYDKELLCIRDVYLKQCKCRNKAVSF